MTPTLRAMRQPFSAILMIAVLAVSLRADELKPPELEKLYGNNDAKGNYVELNGIRMYYEVHGEGPPMLMIHGNGGSIQAMGYQIDYFSPDYRVIVADSRGHGKTEIGQVELTYEQMAADMDALLKHLSLENVAVLGWSDGGNIGILLAINNPKRVAKLAIMGANLNPLGAHRYAFEAMAAQEKVLNELLAQPVHSTEALAIKKQHVRLCTSHPNIAARRLNQIKAPTLVMAADKDVIRNAHTLEIFDAIPRAQLCIFPGATHMIPWEDPKRFNQTAKRFFDEPFTRPDTKDFFKDEKANDQ